jgi:antitoxin MazE
MKTVKIGNSYGIIIPKLLLEKYDLKSQVNLVETPDGLLLKKADNPREGWEEAFIKAKTNGEFEEYKDIPDILDDDFFEEY